MVEKKYKNFLNVILIIVVIAIIAVVSYVVYEYVYLRNIIDANASDILDAFDKYMNEKDKIQLSEGEEVNEIDIENESDNQQATNSGTTPKGVGSYSNSATGYALTYKGYGVLGKIELPKVGLKYPVLETMTNANAIDVSVAVQYGVRIKQGWKYSYNWS